MSEKEQITSRLTSLYEDKYNGIINADTYMELANPFEEKLHQINESINNDKVSSIIFKLSNSAHKSTLINILPTINIPPIVGVPVFTKCVSGPSSLTTCPKFNFLNFSMILGANKSTNINAVATAPAVLNVIYLNRLKPKNDSLNG